MWPTDNVRYWHLADIPIGGDGSVALVTIIVTGALRLTAK